MGGSMCYSFQDLFRAAKRRDMTEAEARRFKNMSQAEKNQMVRQLVKESNGAFKCEDRVGSDGQTYTAFETTGDYEVEPGLPFEVVEQHKLAARCPDVVNGYFQQFQVTQSSDSSGPLVVIDFPLNLTVHIHLTADRTNPTRGHLMIRGSGLGVRYHLTNHEMAMILHHYCERH